MITKDNVMRGLDGKMAKVFFYSSLDSFVPKDHSLRPIRAVVDQALADLCPDFTKMYSHTGRPGGPPEKLLKSLLL
jgi:transposase